MIDIVIPYNNEKEFISIAEKLGYKGLCFLYDFSTYLIKKEKINEIKDNKIKIHRGILANNKNIHKIKNKLKDENIFVAIKSDINDREIIEGSKADIIFSFENDTKRDFIHQRASGLNHILCRLAKENDVIIGFSLNSILNTEKKGVILGRIMQNIKLCRKFKVKTIMASFAESPFEMRSVHDIKSLFELLGGKDITFTDLNKKF